MSDTGTTVIVVEPPAEEVVEAPTEIVVEMSENHDVDFEHRLTLVEGRLEALEGAVIMADIKADIATETADGAADAAATAAAIAVEAAVETEEHTAELEPEPTEKETTTPDEAPASKKNRWFTGWGSK